MKMKIYAKCPSCIFYAGCPNKNIQFPSVRPEVECSRFKDKSKFKELPCQVGDTCYFVTTECNERGEEEPVIYEGRVCTISFTEDNGQWIYARYTCGLTFWHHFADVGKTLFFDIAEAEREAQKQECNNSFSN